MLLDLLYTGWSDVTYLWSQCDRHSVGQHVVLWLNFIWITRQIFTI